MDMTNEEYLTQQAEHIYRSDLNFESQEADDTHLFEYDMGEVEKAYGSDLRDAVEDYINHNGLLFIFKNDEIENDVTETVPQIAAQVARDLDIDLKAEFKNEDIDRFDAAVLDAIRASFSIDLDHYWFDQRTGKYHSSLELAEVVREVLSYE